MKLTQAKEPFQFKTRVHLSSLTGLKAANLKELLELIKGVSGSCIYHHTHRFLQQHQYLSPEPPNDFAYWVREFLNEARLAERLASIDIVEFSTIRSLREKIAATIEEYLKEHPSAAQKFVTQGEELYFIRSISFVLPTPYAAHDLKDFAEIIQKITINSIYFHIFEARLRLEKESNDFSWWLETSLGEKKLAQKISSLDPYTYTLEDLRKTILTILQSRLK